MREWLAIGKEELAEFLRQNRQPAFRAKQIRDWLHQKRVSDFAAMSNLPAPLRAAMAEYASLRSLRTLERRDAADRLTSKWLLALPAHVDNPAALVECVLIIEKQLSRRTVCVSSMAGCPLSCAFCATGRLGMVRNLSAAEIIEQAYLADAYSRGLGDNMGVSHIVFMGMGEPLLNLDAVLTAAAAFADPDGMGLSGRRITISTAGVPDGIRALAETGVNYRLAVSLHAPNQAIREKIMPSARRWPLAQLFPALHAFAAVASRDMTFEYCLVDGLNAAPEQAKELAKLLAGLRCKVNLIPLNPVAGFAGKPPPPQAVSLFCRILEQEGISATIRVEKGGDIGAACGQLKAERVNKA